MPFLIPSIPAFVRAMTARGIPEAQAKSVVEDFREDPNAGTTDRPNGSGFQGNRGVVAGSEDMPGPNGPPFGARGAEGDNMNAEYSDNAPQLPQQDAMTAISQALAVVTTIQKAQTDGFAMLGDKLDLLADALSGASRDGKTGRVIPGGAKPPVLKAAVTEQGVPTISKAAALAKAVSYACDSGMSLSESIACKRLLSIWHQSQLPDGIYDDFKKAYAVAPAASRVPFEMLG